MSRVRAAALALSTMAACTDAHVLEPATDPPVIRAVTVLPNPHNVLSAMVVAEVTGADSAFVRFGFAGGTLADATPVYAVIDGRVEIPLLGLAGDSDYRLQLVARNAVAARTGDMLNFVTGPLPHDLPQYRTSGEQHAGFTLFTAGAWIVAIDHAGRVVWYRRFGAGAGLNVQAQPNGRYTARPAPPAPGQSAAWLELDVLGNVTRTLHCARGLMSRFHDLLMQTDGSYWMMCDEPRIMDLTGIGGYPNAVVVGTVVQYIGADGALRFEWSAFDHFDLADLPHAERAGPLVNWTHGNALDLDLDGNLILSFRSLSEVTKIDAVTGAVLWRLGGARNQFSFESASSVPFARQHGVRVVDRGELLLLDNLGDSSASRAERYLIDEAERTARQTASYASLPPAVAELGGTVQQLAGRVLVSYGSGGRVEEYDAEGRVVWRLEQAGYVFRAQRIRSLYTPGANAPR